MQTTTERPAERAHERTLDAASMRTAVLAVLGGVARTTVAARVGIPVVELVRWVDTFVESGTQGLAGLVAADGDPDARRRDEHLAMVAHELRSPLAMIVGWARLIAHDPDDGDLVRRAASGIDAQATRMNRLAADTMDASAVALGVLSVEVTDTRLADVVKRVADARSVDAPLVDIRDDVWALADGDRLGQVIDNLLENARKHAGAAASVTVSREGDDAVIAISSVGRPIDTATVARMFEPWQRGRTAAGGAGLGLYICRSLMRAHGGEVGVDVDEVGNTFWIRLPAC